MKRNLLLLFALMAIGLTHSWAYDFSAVSPNGQTLYYQIISSSSRTVRVTYPGSSSTNRWSGYEKPTGPLIIPESVSYNGINYSVTGMSSMVFSTCSGITSVVIPNTILTITSSAFSGCSGLTTVTIGAGVDGIMDRAFYGCSNVQTLYFNATNCSPMYTGTASSSSNNYYGLRPLTALRKVIIGDNVQEIPAGAFWGLENISKIEIPNNVSRIGAYAFHGCTGLDSVLIGSSVTSIYLSSFEGCSNVSYLYYNARNCTNFELSQNNSPFRFFTSIEKIVIGDDVDVIPDYFKYFFDLNTSLTDLSISSNVRSIGRGAFAKCGGLTEITIPQNVETISLDAFYGCSALQTVYFNATNCTQMGGGQGPVFMGCSNLTRLVIGENVRSIPAFAFRACSNLNEINFNNTTMLSVIGSEAFSYCTSLQTISLPASLTSIEWYAFSYCSQFSSLIIPNSVNSIGIDAFYGDSQLTIFDFTNIENFTRGSYGTVKRVVKCTTHGSGLNIIHKISDAYSVDNTDANNLENAIPISLIPNNYIYKDGYTYKAKSITLTDCQDEFYSPVEFTAANATYTRTFTDGNRSTLCLPFTTTIPTDFEVYEFTGFNGSTISFTKKESGNIEAYRPYLVGKDITPAAKANTPFTFSKQNAVFPATNITPVSRDNMSFQGVMARTEMTNTNSYGYKDGYFVQSGGSAHVNPFRCFFTLSGNQSAPATLSVDTDGDYLGIEDVDSDMEQTSIRYSNDVYDMMGRLVRKDAESLRGLPRGIYIWRGKKQIAY